MKKFIFLFFGCWFFNGYCPYQDPFSGGTYEDPVKKSCTDWIIDLIGFSLMKTNTFKGPKIPYTNQVFGDDGKSIVFEQEDFDFQAKYKLHWLCQYIPNFIDSLEVPTLFLPGDKSYDIVEVLSYLPNRYYPIEELNGSFTLEDSENPNYGKERVLLITVKEKASDKTISFRIIISFQDLDWYELEEISILTVFEQGAPNLMSYYSVKEVREIREYLNSQFKQFLGKESTLEDGYRNREVLFLGSDPDKEMVPDRFVWGK